MGIAAARNLVRRDLPDVSSRIAETGRANSPRSIERAIHQRDAATRQLGADCIDIIDGDGELKSRAGSRVGDDGRPDELWCLSVS